jgi:hypothetical protein
MGDYVRTIKFFGTTDSFTTQIVCAVCILSYYTAEVEFDQGELAHRALKAFYPLTSKIDTPSQLAKHERRRRVLRRVAEVEPSSGPGQPEANALPPVSSDHHHSIATSQNNPVNLFAFLREHDGDPAIKVEVTFDYGGTLLTAALSEFHTKTEGPYPI